MGLYLLSGSDDARVVAVTAEHVHRAVALLFASATLFFASFTHITPSQTSLATQQVTQLSRANELFRSSAMDLCFGSKSRDQVDETVDALLSALARFVKFCDEDARDFAPKHTS